MDNESASISVTLDAADVDDYVYDYEDHNGPRAETESDFRPYAGRYFGPSALDYANHNLERMRAAHPNKVGDIIMRINTLHKDILAGDAGLDIEYIEALRAAVITWLDSRWPYRKKGKYDRY